MPAFGCSLLWALSPCSLDIPTYFPNMHMKPNVLVCFRKDDPVFLGLLPFLEIMNFLSWSAEGGS